MGGKERRSGSPGGPAFRSETVRADINVKVDTPEGPQATRPWLTVITDQESRLVTESFFSLHPSGT